VNFSNGSNIFTTTTNSSGIAASSFFTANSQIGAVAVTVTVNYATLNPHAVRPRNITGPVYFSLVNTAANGLNQFSASAATLTFDANTSTQQNLTLLAGAGTTNWQASLSYGAGASGWLMINKNSGTLAAGSSTQLILSANKSGLAAGTYSANLNFNDINHSANSITVKVSLIVGGYSYYLPFLSNAVNGYTSKLILQNVGNAPAIIATQYFDQQGNALSGQGQATCSQLANNAACTTPNSLSSGTKGTGVIISTQPLSVLVQESTPYGSSAYAVEAGASMNLVAPVAIHNAEGGFNTQLTIANTGATPTTATINFYDQAGNMLPTAKQTLSLAAHSSQTLDQAAATSKLPDGFYGWAQIDGASGAQLVAQVLEQRSDIKFVALVNAQPVVTNQMYAPAIFKKAFGSFVTGVNIINPSNTTLSIHLNFYDHTGKLYAATPFKLNPYAVAPIYQGASDSYGLPNGFYGSASIMAEGGNIVMMVNEAGMQTAAGTAQSGAYTPGRQGASKLALPVVANNGNGYTSGLTILNSSDQSVSGSLTYYNPDGTQQGQTQSFSLAAHASLPSYQGAANLPLSFYGQAVVTAANNSNSLLATINVQSSSSFYTYTESGSGN
jgi:hypothetical protein